MKMRVKHLLWSLLVPLLALLPPMAAAQSDDFDDLQMNGLAAFEQLRKEYYIGALYLESMSSDAEAVVAASGRKRMSIRITADRWPALRFAQQWNQTILINNSSQELNANVMDVLAFTSLPKDDLIAGDRLTIDLIPHLGTRVTLNGTPMLQTRSDALFRLLVNTWIGPRPATSGFKRDMLKLPTDAAGTDLLARYESLDADAARRKLVAGWGGKIDTSVTAVTETTAAAPAEDTVVRGRSDAAAPAAAAVAVAAPTVSAPAVSAPTIAAPKSVAAAAPAPAAQAAPQTAAAAPKPVEAPAPAEPKPAAAPAPTPAPVQVAAAAPVALPKPAPAVDTSAQQALYSAYSNSLRKLIYAKLSYPKRAVKKEIEGLVVLRISSNRNGQLISTLVAQSAHQILDSAAQEAATKAAPFPAVAADMVGEQFDFMIPVVFKLAD